MLADSSESGMDYAYPDCCWTYVGTATTLVTYPNYDWHVSKVLTQYFIYSGVMPFHNNTCYAAVSSGDELGTNLGTVSGMFIGEVWTLTCVSNIVMSTGMATKWSNVTGQNGIVSNTAGTSLVPDQYVIYMLS